MEISKCQIKTKCDIPGCKELAVYRIQNLTDKKLLLNVCANCANKLYSVLGKTVVPKNIPAPYKNNKKIRG